MSFKKGDTILVKRRINDDWLEGEYQGSTGIFPLNYVELFPYETNEQETNDENEQPVEGEAIAKYDFIPEKTYELQLKKVFINYIQSNIVFVICYFVFYAY